MSERLTCPPHPADRVIPVESLLGDEVVARLCLQCDAQLPAGWGQLERGRQALLRLVDAQS